MMTSNEKRAAILYSICNNHGGKMEGVPSISTSALENATCRARRAQAAELLEAEGCRHICAECYSAICLMRWKSLREKCAKNHNFYTTEELEPCDVPPLNYAFLRLEAFGELANCLQFKNYCTIAACNPSTTFTLWTKNAFIIAAAIKKYSLELPQNLRIIYSTAEIDAKIDAESVENIKSMYPFINAVFSVYTEKYAAQEGIEINCGGRKCIECMNCYKSGGPEIISEALKVNGRVKREA